MQETIPDAEVKIVRRLQDIFSLDTSKSPEMPQYTVISKDRAKLGYGWRPAVVTHRGKDGYFCSGCGEIVLDKDDIPVDLSYLKKNRRFCLNCNSALWQADNQRMRRFAIAEYVKKYLKDYFDFFIAEIQYLSRVGTVLKLLHDHFPATKIVATGSAAFLMLKNIGDSLYGRYIQIYLHPLNFREIIADAHNFDYQINGYNRLIHKPSVEAQLHNVMIYGSLPEVYTEEDKTRKRIILKNHINSLLFKDIFEIEGIRNPQVFKQLLKLLSLQVGSEINPNELSQELEISRKTVLEYISLYEKFRIVYTIRSYSNNPRKEITKGFKVYFSDLGIRNAIIDNFILPENRNDLGNLFENLVVNIFNQNIDYLCLPYKPYFWRTFTRAEVDLVLNNIESNELIPLEIKFSKTKSPSRSFINAYQDRIKQEYCINKDNVWQFI